MKCDGCGAQNAQIAFHVLFGGKKVIRNYCPRCAQMLRRGDSLSMQIAVVNALPDDLLAGLSPCKVCGTTVEDLQKTGRMGCAACYTAFAPVAEEVFKKLGGMKRETSEKVKEESLLTDTQKQIAALRSDLAQAVTAEEYERAAQIRDTINALLKEGETQA